MKIIAFLNRLYKNTVRFPASFPKEKVLNLLDLMILDASNSREMKRIQDFRSAIQKINQEV